MELQNPDDDRIIPFTDVQLKAMAKLYADGMSTIAIGKAYGISQGGVLRRFRAIGVKLRKPGLRAHPAKPVGDYAKIEDALRIATMAHPEGWPDVKVTLSSDLVNAMLKDMARLKAEIECAVGDMRYAIDLADKYGKQNDELPELIQKNTEVFLGVTLKDAARYRWLCDGNGYFMEENMLCGHSNNKAEADAMIDEAMRGV